MNLYNSIKIKDVTSKNRFVLSPMCQYSSHDGFANDWHLVHLGSRAVGGAGIVFTEGAAVNPEGRISPSDLGIWKDEHIEALKRITSFVENQGSVPAIQLAHAGRKASTAPPFERRRFLTEQEGGWADVLAPSPIPLNPDSPVPKVLDKKGINYIVHSFRKAAQRSLQAGFRIIELHFAHGYLIHEFLSPITNKRTDEYGGSFTNRTRLAIECITAVREVWPDNLPLFVRFSMTDYVDTEASWAFGEALELCGQIKNLGVDLIDCSSGGLVPYQKVTPASGYQTHFAAEVRRKADIATGAVGLITSARQADHILVTGQADVVYMARELLRDPYLPLRQASSINADTIWPKQYERSKI
ncbi:MAG: NADH:flavin oxidoreductase/NADH oxidase [Balneolales bacterium]